jgi:hypothetical protein
MIKYTIQITPISNHNYCSTKPYTVEFETNNIEFTMEQYQRNRDPFNWEIVNQKKI